MLVILNKRVRNFDAVSYHRGNPNRISSFFMVAGGGLMSSVISTIHPNPPLIRRAYGKTLSCIAAQSYILDLRSALFLLGIGSTASPFESSTIFTVPLNLPLIREACGKAAPCIASQSYILDALNYRSKSSINRLEVAVWCHAIGNLPLCSLHTHPPLNNPMVPILGAMKVIICSTGISNRKRCAHNAWSN